MKRNNYVDEIKRISIQDVAQRLGLKLHKSGNSLQGNCPTGHPSKNQKCFSINTEKNFFNCFSCGEAGDAITLVELTNKVDFKEAVAWFGQQYNIILPDSITSEDHKINKQIYDNAGLYEEIAAYGKYLLSVNHGAAALDYLQSVRGYDPEKLKETEWLYFPLENILKHHLKSEYPELEDKIYKLPLNSFKEDTSWAAVPYRNRDGLITGFIKRALEPKGINVTHFNGNKENNLRWHSTFGTSKHDLFNLYKCKGMDTLVIVEGYPDASYFPTLGLKNIVAIGAGKLTKTHLEGLNEFGVRNVIISFDNDPPDEDGISVGFENTKTAVKLLLTESNINVFVIPPEKLRQHKDPDEYVRANGIDEFYGLVGDAESGPKWFAKQLITEYDLSKDLQKQQALDAALDFDLLLKDQFVSRAFREGVADVLSMPLDVIELKATSYKQKKDEQRIQGEFSDLCEKSKTMVKSGKTEEAMKFLDKQFSVIKNDFYKTKLPDSMSLGDHLREKYQIESQRTAELLGYPLTKFKNLAKYIDGVQPGLYIIGAETNAGKTAMLTNLCLDLVQTNKDVRALYFSLDDSKNVIINRFLGILSELDLNQVQRKQENEENGKKLKNAYNDLITLADNGRLYIKDLGEVTHFKQAEAVINELYNDKFAVFLDGLYNLDVDIEKSDIRKENVERAKMLKTFCDRYRIPLICTAELRKKAKDEGMDKKPTVHDLMESGKFGYNANIVWLLAPKSSTEAKSNDEYAVQLDYGKNKLSYYKSYQDLWFKKMKGIMNEPMVMAAIPSKRNFPW